MPEQYTIQHNQTGNLHYMSTDIRPLEQTHIHTPAHRYMPTPTNTTYTYTHTHTHAHKHTIDIYVQTHTQHAHTCPNADKDLLIAAASTNRMPLASVRDMRSEPARSTRVNRPSVMVPDTLSWPSTVRINSKWERELEREGTVRNGKSMWK